MRAMSSMVHHVLLQQFWVHHLLHTFQAEGEVRCSRDFMANLHPASSYAILYHE